MNQTRRKTLNKALEYLAYVSRLVEQACDEEGDARDNCPENLQGSDRYESMEIAADALEDAVSALDELKDKIEEAIGA